MQVKLVKGDLKLLEQMGKSYIQELSKTSCQPLKPVDFISYFENRRKAYLIQKAETMVGFVLMHEDCILPKNKYHLAEFFILPKFQHQNLGFRAAIELWDHYPGHWEVAVLLANTSAKCFWEKAISSYTKGNFTKEVAKVKFDHKEPERLVFSFSTST